EGMSAEGAKERQKLVNQLSLTKVEKFDYISGWGYGVSEGRIDEEILAALHGASNFDAYSDKKLYPMYGKLFEMEYAFIMKITSGYRHSVANLLKMHHDHALFDDTSAPTISTAFARASLNKT
ncbi:hypothetical protein Tco_1322361, partial [Tanacetum coccineum]